MVWHLTQKPHRVFPRNPLAAVIVDLRFHPILKIGSKVPDFQESVRSVFADYQEQPHQFVMVQPFGGVQVSHEKIFTFKKSDGTATLNLSTSSLTLDSRQHAHRDQLISEAALGVDALLRLYAPVQGARLGLRYVNFVDCKAISKDLGRDVGWHEVITERFLAVPSGLAQGEGTLYNIEVSSGMSEGEMTLRYGILRDPRDGAEKFRFDLDRYVDAPFESARVREYLAHFSADMYSVFMDAKGPALEEWMLKGDTSQ